MRSEPCLLTDNAPTIFRNVRNGNRLVHDVRIRVFSPQLIEIGRNELKIGVPINFVPKFAEPAKSGPSLDVEGEGRIRALRKPLAAPVGALIDASAELGDEIGDRVHDA